MKLSWQVLGLTAWLVALLWIGFELRGLNAPVTRHGDAVGRVVGKTGSVKIKPGNSLIWSDVANQEHVFAGDIIATAQASQVGVTLLDGRRVNVEQESMVTIDSLGGGDEFNRQLTLDLMQGKLNVANPPKEKHAILATLLETIEPAPPSLAVRTDDHEYVVPAGGESTLQIAQPLGEPSTMTGFTGAVTVTDKTGTERPLQSEDIKVAPVMEAQAIVAVVAPKALVVEEPTADFDLDLEPPVEPKKRPKKVDPPAPPPKVPPMAATVAGAPHRAFLTMASWQCANLGDLPVKLGGVGDGESGEGWRPFVDATIDAHTRRVFGQPTADLQDVGLPLGALCAELGTMPPTLKVTLSTGGLAADGVERLGDEQKLVVLSSLSQLATRPVTIYLKRIAARQQPVHGWLPLSAFNPVTDYPYELRLNDGALLPGLAKIFTGNGGVTIKGGAAPMDQGIHFVRGGQIVATLGVERRTRLARTLAKALGAELAFFGRRDDYVSLPAASISRLEAVERLIQKNDQVHLFSRNRLIAVAQEDLNDGVGAFATVVMTSRVAFTDKVDVIVP